MNSILWNAVSIALYLSSGGCYAGSLLGRSPRYGRAANALLVMGLAAHLLGLLGRATIVGGVPYVDLGGSMSLFSWYLGLMYLGLELYYRQRSMSLFLLLILILLQLVAIALPPSPIAVDAAADRKGALFAFHVNLSMMAYSAFALSFCASVLYLIQYRRLRSQNPGRWSALLPSLHLLERLNRSSVIIGVVTLGAGLATGGLWARQAWKDADSPWDPKIAWSLLTLAIYSLFLFLHHRTNWRGPRSTWITTVGFLTAMASYTLVNLLFSRLHTFS